MRQFTIFVFFISLLVCLCSNNIYACTCFCLDTPDGPIFGSNLDLFIPGDGLVFINQRNIQKEGFQKSTTGKTVKWTSKYGSITFNIAGREFAFGGMNEAGLVVGGMELRASELPKPDARPPLTLGTWVQYVLDNFRSVKEVMHVDSKVRIEDSSPPSHFLIADAKGNCAAIEWLDGKFVYRTGSNLPVKAMSNMRYDRALSALKRGGPRWWWSNPGQSAERFADAYTRNKNFDATRDKDVIKYAFESLTHVVAAPHTKWNIVYDIAKREIWFRSVRSPAVKHVSLNDFNLSCSAPLLMLDVNAPLEGNVKQAFIHYDHDTNLTVFRMLRDRYKLDISEEDTVGIVRHFESFKCAQ